MKNEEWVTNNLGSQELRSYFRLGAVSTDPLTVAHLLMSHSIVLYVVYSHMTSVQKVYFVNLNFSQAVIVDKTLYTSGQLGMDPATGDLVKGGIVPEAEQVWVKKKNLWVWGYVGIDVNTIDFHKSGLQLIFYFIWENQSSLLHYILFNFYRLSRT